MTITIPKSGIIDLRIFEKMLDISKIVWYSFEVEGSHAILKFYDKQKRIIKPYGQKETKKSKANNRKVKK